MRIFQSEKALNVRARSNITDLYGEKVNLNEHRPRCHFFPDQVAQIMGKAGTGETYRTYFFRGKRVPISSKFHNFIRELKKEIKGISSGQNLNDFIDTKEEIGLVQFLQ